MPLKVDPRFPGKPIGLPGPTCLIYIPTWILRFIVWDQLSISPTAQKVNIDTKRAHTSPNGLHPSRPPFSNQESAAINETFRSARAFTNHAIASKGILIAVDFDARTKGSGPWVGSARVGRRWLQRIPYCSRAFRRTSLGLPESFRPLHESIEYRHSILDYLASDAPVCPLSTCEPDLSASDLPRRCYGHLVHSSPKLFEIVAEVFQEVLWDTWQHLLKCFSMLQFGEQDKLLRDLRKTSLGSLEPAPWDHG